MVVAGANHRGDTRPIGPVAGSSRTSDGGAWCYLLRLMCLKPSTIAIEDVPFTDRIFSGDEGTRQPFTWCRILQVRSEKSHGAQWFSGSATVLLVSRETCR